MLVDVHGPQFTLAGFGKRISIEFFGSEEVQNPAILLCSYVRSVRDTLCAMVNAAGFY